MNENINYGNQINQSGGHNTARMETTYGTPDVQGSIRELVRAVQVLQGHVSTAERQIIDESLETVRRAEHAEPGRLRRALGNIAGIATVMGQVGAPAVEAVRKVLTALGV